MQWRHTDTYQQTPVGDAPGRPHLPNSMGPLAMANSFGQCHLHRGCIRNSVLSLLGCILDDVSESQDYSRHLNLLLGHSECRTVVFYEHSSRTALKASLILSPIESCFMILCHATVLLLSCNTLVATLSLPLLLLQS